MRHKLTPNSLNSGIIFIDGKGAGYDTIFTLQIKQERTVSSLASDGYWFLCLPDGLHEFSSV